MKKKHTIIIFERRDFGVNWSQHKKINNNKDPALDMKRNDLAEQEAQWTTKAKKKSSL